MALTDTNKIQLSLKKLFGKAHTQEGFELSEEGINSTLSASYETIFGQPIQPDPISVGGLTVPYDDDLIVEKLNFELDIIPDTEIGTNQSQGYRLKLPSDYDANGVLYSAGFTAGTYLHNTVGKLQVVPSLYGTLSADGSTEYDPVLLETDNNTIIPKNGAIDWVFDPWSGIVFIQDPPAGFDIDSARPGFMNAFLFVGDYLDAALTGLSGVSDYNNLTNIPATFAPSTHIHPISEVDTLTSALVGKQATSEKGNADGYAPLDSNSLVPVVHIPPSFKEIRVFADIPERDLLVFPSGTTGLTGSQVASFEGFRVFILEASGDTAHTISGSAEYMDILGQTGSTGISWFLLPDPETIVVDWTNVQNAPVFIENIVAGNALSSIPTQGTGTSVTLNVEVDGSTIEVNADQLRIVPSGITQGLLSTTGSTGASTYQLTSDGIGGFVWLPQNPATLEGFSAGTGLIDTGTATVPKIAVRFDTVDGTVTDTGSGLRVANLSLGRIKLNTGQSATQISDRFIPIWTGGAFTGTSIDISGALGELQSRIETNISNIASGDQTNLALINANTIGITANTASIDAFTGETVGSGSGITFRDRTGNIFNIKSLLAGTNISITDQANEILFDVTGVTAGSSSVIGDAEDGTYTDGLFDDFVSGTSIGTATDRFNEVLLELSPNFAPLLDDLSGGGTLVNGKLSWGVSRNDIGYVNVGTIAGNPAVDINGSFTSSGNRMGITQSAITGTLNDDVLATTSYFADSFKNGDKFKGELLVELNGAVVETFQLSATGASATGLTAGTYVTLSALTSNTYDNGNTVDNERFRYRQGEYTIPTSAMVAGHNYLRIIHTGATFTGITNYEEWVYDSASTIISISASSFQNLSLGGNSFLSGVDYHTGGTVEVTAVGSNVYRNVYSSNAGAISFPSRINLADSIDISVIGTGIDNRTNDPLKTLPTLDSGVTNPEFEDVTLTAVLAINATQLLGVSGNTGKIQSGLGFLHPFTSKSFSGVVSATTGFLLSTITDPNNLEIEFFSGETNRLKAQDYTGLTYTSINGGTHNWGSTNSLVGASATHNTGLLIFNGELMYPNTSYLTTTYGITTGNFQAVLHGQSAVNYGPASGGRDFYRKFKSNNGVIQSSLTFEIDHTGVEADFMISGGTSGIPTGDKIKFEFLIKRSDNTTHGWANPFAPVGNPEGISNTSVSTAGGTTTVSCTLSTVPRIGNADIVIGRLFVADGWSNRITRIAITNI